MLPELSSYPKPSRQTNGQITHRISLDDTESHVFLYRDLGEGGNAVWSERAGGHGDCGWVTATWLPGRPFLYRFLHPESRVSGAVSISLDSRKNVPDKITE